MNRTAYHRAFYRDTAPRRRELANARRQAKRAAAWLLAELGVLRRRETCQRSLSAREFLQYYVAPFIAEQRL